YRRAGTHRRSAPHAHRRHQLHVGTDMHVIPDHRAVLVGAVIVAGDGAGAEVDVAAHRRIADIGQMVGLGGFADCARLGLDEVADVHLRRQLRAGPDARIRSDAATGADAGTVEVAEGFDAGAGADGDVFEHAV